MERDMIDTELLEKAYNMVRSEWPSTSPKYMVALGSGWSDVVESFDIAAAVDYSDIPGMGATSVAGHAGRMVLATRGGTEMLIFQGRRHIYEGVDWTPIALPVYIAKRMKVEMCLLTNAAGGIREDMKPGDLMIMIDHINMLGCNPLEGPHDPFWGPRFPDQSHVYDPELQNIMEKCGVAVERELQRGVYVATKGPTFETPAEIRACRVLGAAAVGMSTVPEAILANAVGMRVAGLSFITNLAAGILDKPLTHEEVMEVSRNEMPRLCRFFEVLFGEHLQ